MTSVLFVKFFPLKSVTRLIGQRAASPRVLIELGAKHVICAKYVICDIDNTGNNHLPLAILVSISVFG